MDEVNDTWQGHLDRTTGLPLRDAFVTKVRTLQGSDNCVTIVSLDIDGFTELNEVYGATAGDAILREVALRCRQICAECAGACILGRVGPDDFALAMAWPGSVDADPLAQGRIEQVIRRLVCLMAVPFKIPGDAETPVHVTIGQANVGAGVDVADALVRAVAARRRGSGEHRPVHNYESQTHEELLTQELRKAIVAERIEISLQPKVALATGSLVGFEALARWTLAPGRPVPPGVFIPLAERHGLINELGEVVLRRALATLANWRALGLPLVPIAVNFATPQFQQQQITARISQALARYDLSPKLLELELTESMFLDGSESTLQTLQSLSQLGLCLSIDDFGTGYSSLAYLRRAAVHCLKIDRSLISDINDDPRALEIVQFVLQLAHRLNLHCVAEGIETRDQLAVLRRLGCDQGQGFLLSHPVAPHFVEEWLKSGAGPWRFLFSSRPALERAVAAHIVLPAASKLQ
jgi:diguanylate cyclase (GGDEF)-like protein